MEVAYKLIPFGSSISHRSSMIIQACTTCKLDAIVYPRLFPPRNMDIAKEKINLCAAKMQALEAEESLCFAVYTARERKRQLLTPKKTPCIKSMPVPPT